MSDNTLKDGTLLRGGAYRIIRYINAGGFGCTYEAVHTGLKRRVAIKEFFAKEYCNRDPQTSRVYVGTQSKKDLAEKLKRKFLDEASAVANLNHPGIVRVADVFEENGTAYFVMEYIDGRGLNQLIADRGHLPEDEALRYIRQAANALAYVHGTNRLHLDIKPGNIMIDKNGNAILIDFGLSKQYDEVSGENNSTLLGISNGYSPLEQWSRKVRKFTPATDIYALAATLYKAVTGMTPPDAADLHNIEELTFPAHLSAPVVNAIEAALQMRAKDRPQSVAEFLAILDAPDTSAKTDSNAQPTSEATVTANLKTTPKVATAAQTTSEKTVVDPRSLWLNIPTPADIPFYKPDTAIDFVKVESQGGKPSKGIVAASNRGRSHAHEGKARDDHFRLHYGQDNGWYVIAVADGKGGAKYSRKGSQVACDTIVNFCIEKLKCNVGLESAIAEYYAARNDQADETSARKRCGHLLYSILVQGAFNAYKAINELSLRTPETKPHDFSTTLMVAICKKFDFGWFFGTFWVGNGVVCIYDKENQSFALLCTPDKGEYTGQTRYLTMPEIFRDSKDLYQRMHFGFRDNFTALMLMTDGVSSPMFGTEDANLANIESWNRFWTRLAEGFPEDGIGGVEFTNDNEAAAQQLLDWLNFWVPGEHDDRTLAILY